MVKTILVILSLLWLPGASLGDDSPLQRLRHFLARAQTLQADFTQVTVDDKGEPQKRSSGVFYLVRPGKFRWEYRQPYRQEIVASGGKVWFYDVDLEQVTAKRLHEAIGSTPALLLSGAVALETDFTIEQQAVDEGVYWIKLVPKAEDSGFRYLLLGLEGTPWRAWN